ncbi:MAG: PqqD family protein [Pyrinomonadaceae bacterium]|nr:PqqD family protein [Pyrinomonadaceae bacterium]
MQNYRINTPHIVSEVFADEEAAIINLKTGNYYSLNKTATEIWSLIEKGFSFDEIMLFFQNNFKLDDSFQINEIKQFIENLIDEGLISAFDEPALTQTQSEDSPRLNQKEYEPPFIECYPDMQELLLLDPIHEVEETNWLVNKTK